MEQLDYRNILNRKSCADKIKQALKDFQDNKNNLLQVRGIYVYGAPGSGKTYFVKKVLEEAGYDIVKYDAGDIRNKNIIETITKQNMADRNVLSMFKKKSQPIVIMMDEIDGMNSGDKGGINALIKLIRPKKTKKQKLEASTSNPVVCISNYHIDKKIQELMKVCVTVELKTPTDNQIKKIISKTMKTIDDKTKTNIITYLQGDLRKFSSINKMFCKHQTLLKSEIIQKIFKKKSYNEDTKEITKRLLNENLNIEQHLSALNETDRTIVGLLWHENIVDCLSKLPYKKAFPMYLKALNNICYADYIDRVTFQKQIWQFNEMSSLIKTFNNNKIYHNTFNENIPKYNPDKVRFTKVLTKYSTEYNNSVFIQNICQQLSMDRKDVFSFFLDLRNKHTCEEIYDMFESYDINKLDINRMYRYLDKYTKQDI